MTRAGDISVRKYVVLNPGNAPMKDYDCLCGKLVLKCSHFASAGDLGRTAGKKLGLNEIPHTQL